MKSTRLWAWSYCVMLSACAFKPDPQARPASPAPSSEPAPQAPQAQPLEPSPESQPEPELAAALPASASEVPAPPVRELVIEGTLPLGAESLFGHYDRVIFKSQARLVTNGQDVDLTTDELISEGGSILAFEPGQRASPGQGGRAGGNIFLRARTARGVLLINARGEAGGDGVAGAPGSPGVAGVEGIPGIWSTCLAGVGYTGCLRDATDGSPGGNGGNGYVGGDGGTGGESARVVLEIQDTTGLTLRTDLRGGAGGAPGPGGQGGAPGPGGATAPPLPPKDQWEHVITCRGSHAGPAGAAGSPGPQGKAGNEGRSIPIQIRR